MTRKIGTVGAPIGLFPLPRTPNNCRSLQHYPAKNFLFPAGQYLHTCPLCRKQFSFTLYLDSFIGSFPVD